MKIQYLLLILSLGLLSYELYGQQNDEKSKTPDLKYDVHRTFDENGNLVEYDSSSVITWTYSDSDSDSLANTWSPGPTYPPDSSVTEDYYSYGRHLDFPDFGLSHFPHFDHGSTFPEIDSILGSLELYISKNLPDSSFRPCDPHDNSDQIFPPMHSEQGTYIYDIQKQMDKIREDYDKIYREFMDPELSEPHPDESFPDSVTTPPVLQGYSSPILNI